MVGGGMTSGTIPRNVTYDSTTPTGGWDLYDEQRIAYAYYSMGPSKIEDPDPRKNPKNWALWFREFLTSLFPSRCDEIMNPVKLVQPVRIIPRCRSGTIPIREWKMKNWIQALA